MGIVRGLIQRHYLSGLSLMAQGFTPFERAVTFVGAHVGSGPISRRVLLIAPTLPRYIDRRGAIPAWDVLLMRRDRPADV
jgi:hypothetical protein